MKKIVLVIDDDQDIGNVVKHGLEYFYPAQYMVIPVKNSEDCFKLLNNSCKPDVILLDVMLPDMSECKIYNKLKKNDLWKNVPIIFLSEKNNKTAQYVGNVLGEFFIEKPFSISNLKKTIDKIIDKT